MYANLHLHSIYSDGVQTPDELCRKAKALGYGAVSLTEHQTSLGNAEMARAAQAYGLDYINGIEVYAKFGDRNVHMTAYGFDDTTNEMREFLRINLDAAYSFTKKKFEALLAAGIFGGITWQDVLDDAPDGAWLCGEHIHRTLRKRCGFRQQDYYSYREKAVPVERASGAVMEYKTPEAAEMIGLFHRAGGVIMLAHPHGITDMIPQLYELGLDGAEWQHPDIDENDSAAVLTFAKEHSFYLTGGTDHTGELANDMERDPTKQPKGYLRPLGAHVEHGATKEQFEALKSRVFG